MFVWWAQMESNHRPHAYQACALTIWAMSPYFRVVSSVILFNKEPSLYFSMYFLRVHWKINNKPSPEDWTQSIFQNFVFLLRKEVIQPHLLIRLPCYDFTPVVNPTFGSVLLAVRLLTSGVTNSHGVTGGVYKTRERIHRSILICDY